MALGRSPAVARGAFLHHHLKVSTPLAESDSNKIHIQSFSRSTKLHRSYIIYLACRQTSVHPCTSRTAVAGSQAECSAAAVPDVPGWLPSGIETAGSTETETAEQSVRDWVCQRTPDMGLAADLTAGFPLCVVSSPLSLQSLKLSVKDVYVCIRLSLSRGT